VKMKIDVAAKQLDSVVAEVRKQTRL
jgi:hypothetical protein